MTMSLSTGLISGMDTGSLISQLIQAEAAPQNALKTRLAVTNTTATAYRTVNTAFAALRAAGEALTPTALSGARKASSSDTAVTTSATATAVVGTSVTFSVVQTASTQSLVTQGSWASPTTPVRDQTGISWPIEVRNLATGAFVEVDVAPGATLAEAAAAINSEGLGLTASVIKTDTDEYRLHITSKTSGGDGAFVITSGADDPDFPGSAFRETTPGQDATLDFGGGILAKSASNTFADLLAGVSLTVSKAGGDPTTISVDHDYEAVTTKMQALVDAVSSTLETIKKQTLNAPGSTAPLRGEFSVTSLGTRLLDEVARSVGSLGSPAIIGLELTKDGKITFDKSKFTTALKDTPELVQTMVAGAPATTGPGGAAVPAVEGLAERLAKVGKLASDATTGTLVSLANGQDSLAKDIKTRIENWDLRLAKRRQILARQFTAMETSLSSLRNQSTWLAGQINSLPS